MGVCRVLSTDTTITSQYAARGKAFPHRIRRNLPYHPFSFFQFLKLSFTAAVPVAGVVNTLFCPLSQVTAPLSFRLTNLY
jgi:hypothetical protein